MRTSIDSGHCLWSQLDETTPERGISIDSAMVSARQRDAYETTPEMGISIDSGH